MSAADGVWFSTSTTFAASGLLRTYLLLVKLRHSITKTNNVHIYPNIIRCCRFAAVLTTQWSNLAIYFGQKYSVTLQCKHRIKALAPIKVKMLYTPVTLYLPNRLKFPTSRHVMVFDNKHKLFT